MTRRAYEICSNNEELTKELEHLKKVFTTINGYPHSLVVSVMKKIKDQQQQEEREESPDEADEECPADEQPTEPKFLMLKVPYAGEKGETIMEDLNTTLTKNLPENIKCRIVQTGTKLQR